MKLSVDRESRVPVYLQIAGQLRSQILAGQLLPGYRLPPERQLAVTLGINRTTALAAYREPKAEGLIGSHVGKGTLVLGPPEEGETAPEGPEMQEPAWNQFFSDYSNRFDSYVINDLLRLANRGDVISFATGIASPELGPLEAIKGFENQLVEEGNYRGLLHSPVEGFSSLREVVSGYMGRRGCYCPPAEVMMLSGSQQGIDLVARVLLNPGDIVVVEEPTFFPALQTFKMAGARVMGVPMDSGGMDMDVLEQLLERYRPKLIYTIPTFHNPTGTEMELERRKRLVELAHRYKVLVLEDDAYGELCYEGESPPTLKSMDRAGYVMYLNTFSKIVYPGLRLGWMVAHRRLIQRFAATRQLVDLHANCLSQQIIQRFMESGGLDTHLEKVKREYGLSRDRMDMALSQYAPPGMTWSKPRGGYYIWCTLPPGVSAARLVEGAARHRVAFLPGNAFFVSSSGDGHIRLNFTFAPREDIEEGVKRLCAAVKEQMERVEGEELFPDVEINPVL